MKLGHVKSFVIKFGKPLCLYTCELVRGVSIANLAFGLSLVQLLEGSL